MAITQKSIKILWANAAGRCAFPGCQCRLCTSDAGAGAPHTIGEMAHISGEKPGASRYNASQSQNGRDDYTNLILLCPTHHTTIDKPENEKRYTIEILQKMKLEHETYVHERLEVRKLRDKHEVASYVYPLLKENHQVFSTYGPQSEIARRNPDSDAHGIWLSERLATIVPNNRTIAEIMSANSSLFTPQEQVVLNKFALHARTYEGWVKDEITYEGVTRFPQEFDELISELANVGA